MLRSRWAAVGLSAVCVAVGVGPVVADDSPTDDASPRQNLTVPSPPQDVVAYAESAGDDHFKVHWRPSLDNGGLQIQYYFATVSPGEETCQVQALAMTMECGFGDLERNRSYTVTVTAENALGRSQPSASSNPVTLRARPTITALKARDHRVQVRWNRSVDSGGIVAFEARAIGRKQFCRALSFERSCVVSGLKNGRKYRFEVSLIGSSGPVITSKPSKIVVPGRGMK